MGDNEWYEDGDWAAAWAEWTPIQHEEVEAWIQEVDKAEWTDTLRYIKNL